MAMVNLNIKVDEAVLERLEDEAATAGVNRSRHARDILVAHLTGNSLDRVREAVSDLRDEIESQRAAVERIATRLGASQDLQTRAVLFGLETVIFNLPNGGESAVKLFRSKYLEEIEKGG